MTFKKSVISYGFWAFYLILAFVAHVGVTFSLLEHTPITNSYVKIGMVCLSFVLAVGVFLLIRRIINSRTIVGPAEATKKTVVLEAVLVLLLFVAGILLRFFMFGQNGEEATYFEWASVNGQPFAALSHGAQLFYVYLLRGLFFLFGNHFQAGIVLQIIMQMLMAVVWYFAIRKMAGKIPAFVLLAGIMLLPKSISLGLTYTPKVMYLLLFGVVLCILSSFWGRFQRQTPLKWYSWLQTTILGIGIGFVTYLDVTGIALLGLLIFALAIKPEEEINEPYTQLQKLLQVLLGLLISVVSLVGFFFAQALRSGSGVDKIANVWYNIFAYKGIVTTENLTLVMGGDLVNSIVGILATLILFAAAIAFFTNGKSEIQMPWLVFVLVIGIFYAGNFHADSMNCEYLLMVAMIILTGVGIRSLIMVKEKAIKQNADVEIAIPVVPEKVQEPETTKTPENVQEPETTKTPENTQEPETVNTVEAPKEKKINYIENPLPLPKKHVKKTMGYRIDVSPEDMKYDVEVSDTDDFDIK